MIKFKVGEVVKMKSGGPDMVVVDETRNGLNLICKWWDSAGECYQQDTFPHESLCLSDTHQD